MSSAISHRKGFIGTVLLLVIASFLALAIIPSAVDIKKDASFGRTVSQMADELAGVVRENIRTGTIASNVMYEDGSIQLYDGIIARQEERIDEGFPVLVWTYYFPGGGFYDVNGTYRIENRTGDVVEKWYFYADGTGYYETYDDGSTFYTDELLTSWTSRADAPPVPPVPVINMETMTDPANLSLLPRTTYAMLYDNPLFSGFSAEYLYKDGIITVIIDTAGREVENPELYGLEPEEGKYKKQYVVR